MVAADGEADEVVQATAATAVAAMAVEAVGTGDTEQEAERAMDVLRAEVKLHQVVDKAGGAGSDPSLSCAGMATDRAAVSDGDGTQEEPSGVFQRASIKCQENRSWDDEVVQGDVVATRVTCKLCPEHRVDAASEHLSRKRTKVAAANGSPSTTDETGAPPLESSKELLSSREAPRSVAERERPCRAADAAVGLVSQPASPLQAAPQAAPQVAPQVAPNASPAARRTTALKASPSQLRLARALLAPSTPPATDAPSAPPRTAPLPNAADAAAAERAALPPASLPMNDATHESKATPPPPTAPPASTLEFCRMKRPQVEPCLEGVKRPRVDPGMEGVLCHSSTDTAAWEDQGTVRLQKAALGGGSTKGVQGQQHAQRSSEETADATNTPPPTAPRTVTSAARSCQPASPSPGAKPLGSPAPQSSVAPNDAARVAASRQIASATANDIDSSDDEDVSVAAYITRVRAKQAASAVMWAAGTTAAEAAPMIGVVASEAAHSAAEAAPMIGKAASEAVQAAAEAAPVLGKAASEAAQAAAEAAPMIGVAASEAAHSAAEAAPMIGKTASEAAQAAAEAAPMIGKTASEAVQAAAEAAPMIGKAASEAAQAAAEAAPMIGKTASEAAQAAVEAAPMIGKAASEAAQAAVEAALVIGKAASEAAQAAVEAAPMIGVAASEAEQTVVTQKPPVGNVATSGMAALTPTPLAAVAPPAPIVPAMKPNPKPSWAAKARAVRAKAAAAAPAAACKELKQTPAAAQPRGGPAELRAPNMARALNMAGASNMAGAAGPGALLGAARTAHTLPSIPPAATTTAAATTTVGKEVRSRHLAVATGNSAAAPGGKRGRLSPITEDLDADLDTQLLLEGCKDFLRKFRKNEPVWDLGYHHHHAPPPPNTCRDALPLQ